MKRYGMSFGMGHMFFLILIMAALCVNESYAQESYNVTSDAQSTRWHEIKLNSIVLVGIIDPAVEFRVSDRWSMQGEVLLSPYFNNCLGTGKPFACALGYVETRYYVHSPRHPYSGFFFGPVAGGGAYKMNKGIYPLYHEQYKGDCYQQGWNMMLGLSLGYKFNLTSRWSLELNWGGGYQHSWYRGFERDSKEEPYRMYVDWNKDAEFLPFFKGGVMVGYSF